MSITYEKTWAFDFNRDYTPSTALDLTRYTMWLLASQLVGGTGGLTLGLWTLYASSDSVTAGTDSTDRWAISEAYDGSKIVRGSGSSIHSWIVLRSPSMNGANWYMILSFNSATDAAIRISFCKTAPTSGSITVTPTSTDQWWPNSSSISAADYTINAATIDSSRFSIGLSSGGDFFFIGCKQRTGFPNLIIQFHALSDYVASDQAPIWNQVFYSANGRMNSVDPNQYGGFGDNTSTGGTITRKYDLTAAARANSICIPLFTDSSSTKIFPFQTSSATASRDIAIGRRFVYPAWVMQCVAGGTSPVLRGRIADIFVIPEYVEGLPNGISLSPIIGDTKYIRVFGLLHPANTYMNFS